MKQLILAGAFLLSSIIALGQNSKDIISKTSEVVSSMGCVEVSFDFSAIKSTREVIGEQQGTFISQGESFVVLTDALEVYCDGKSKWIYDRNSQEITIINHDPNLSDMTENPFSVFKHADAIYDYVGKAKKVGENWVVDMKPKDSKINYSLVELTVKAADYIPVSIKYTSTTGDTYEAVVKSLQTVSPKDDSFFTIDYKTHDYVIVTDLR